MSDIDQRPWAPYQGAILKCIADVREKAESRVYVARAAALSDVEPPTNPERGNDVSLKVEPEPFSGMTATAHYACSDRGFKAISVTIAAEWESDPRGAIVAAVDALERVVRGDDRTRALATELSSQVEDCLWRERELMRRVESARVEVAEALGMPQGEIPPSWKRVAEAARAMRSYAESSQPPCDDTEGNELSPLRAFERLADGKPVQVRIGSAWRYIFAIGRKEA